MDVLKIQLSILVDLLRRKSELLEEILRYTKDQEISLKENSLKRFEIYGTYKKQPIEEIQKIDEHFQMVFERILKEQNISNFEELKIEKETLKELKTLIQKVTELSIQIQTIESKNQFQIDQNLFILKEEFKTLSNQKPSQNAISEYQKNKKSNFPSKP